MHNNAYWQGYAEAALQRGVDPQMLQKSAVVSSHPGGMVHVPGVGAVSVEVLAALLGGGLGAGVGYGMGGGEGALLGGLGGAGLGYGGAAGARAMGAFPDIQNPEAQGYSSTLEKRRPLTLEDRIRQSMDSST